MSPQPPAASRLELSSSSTMGIPSDRPCSLTESPPSLRPDSRLEHTSSSRSTVAIPISLRPVLPHLPPAPTPSLLPRSISPCRSLARRQLREPTAPHGSTPCISLRSAAPSQEMCSSQQITTVLCSVPTPSRLQRYRRLVGPPTSSLRWRRVSLPRTSPRGACRANFHRSCLACSCCLFWTCDIPAARARD